MKVAVRHREGVCMAVEKRSLAYEDHVKTRCGYFVSFPWGLCRGYGAEGSHSVAKMASGDFELLAEIAQGEEAP